MEPDRRPTLDYSSPPPWTPQRRRSALEVAIATTVVSLWVLGVMAIIGLLTYAYLSTR